MYQPAPSTNSTHSLPNGHLSPASFHDQSNQIMTPESESELSEALDGPNAALSSPTHDADNGVQAAYHPNESGSSHDEDAIGYDDEEYAMDDYAAPTVHPPSHGSRSSSQTSSKLGKRKASVEEDDFMQNDPELYGLRRSVSHARFTPRVVY